jgi:hypothetical protein
LPILTKYVTPQLSTQHKHRNGRIRTLYTWPLVSPDFVRDSLPQLLIL